MHETNAPIGRIAGLLIDPPTPLRLAAALLALALVANLFVLGARPWAAGWIPTPWDRLAHLALFGSVAGLGWIVFGGRGAAAHVGAVAIAAGVGLLDEFVQLRLPGRSADARDLLADFAGAALAVLLLWALRARRARAGEPGRCVRVDAGPG
jgi:VanZ family protein